MLGILFCTTSFHVQHQSIERKLCRSFANNHAKQTTTLQWKLTTRCIAQSRTCPWCQVHQRISVDQNDRAASTPGPKYRHGLSQQERRHWTVEWNLQQIKVIRQRKVHRRCACRVQSCSPGGANMHHYPMHCTYFSSRNKTVSIWNISAARCWQSWKQLLHIL